MVDRLPLGPHMSELPYLPSITEVFAQLVDSIAVYERNGRVQYLNPTTEQVFGIPSDAVRGKILWELFPVARGNLFHQLFEQVAADGQTRSFEHYYAPYDRWYDNTIYAIGDHIVAWGRDITPIKRDAERLEFLWQCSQRLAQAGVDFSDVVSSAVQEVVRNWADTSSIILRDEETGELRVAAWDARTEEGRRHAAGQLSSLTLHSTDSMIAGIIARGEPVLVSEVDAQQMQAQVQPELRAYVEAYPPRSSLVVPLRLGGRVIGVLQATRHENQRLFHEVDLQILQELASRVALSIHNAQLFVSQQMATRRAELLQSVSAALSSAVTPGDIASVFEKNVIPALGGAAGGLLVLSEDGQQLIVVSQKGYTDDYVARYQRHALTEPLPSGEAARTGKALYFESRAELCERFPALAAHAASQGYEASAVVPMIGRAGPIGVLTFQYAGGRRFLQDERSLIESLAVFFAQALERARLYELERQSAARQRLLADASRAFAQGKLAVDEVVARVVETAGRELGDGCTLMFRGADQSSLVLQAAWHADPELCAAIIEILRQTPSIVGLGVNGKVLATGEGIFLPEIDQEALSVAAAPGHREFLRRHPLTSMICAPLRVEGQVVGTLALVRYQPSPAHTRSEFSVLQELADLAALAIANAQKFERVQESDRRKDEFLAMLAHELRNPLAPMKTALDLMKIRGAGVVSREWEIVDRQLGHLARLVDDLLDVSRITHGRVQLEKNVLDLWDVLGKALEQAGPLIQQRSHRLHIEPPTTPLYVQGDADRLAQVFTNLLTNAAKYTPQAGDITVRISASGKQAVLSVEDTGHGIAPDMLNAVFELFVQGERSLDRREGGLGLGLTLVRKLVELHGGSVSAHSLGKGHGSTFTVRLPLHAAPAVLMVSSGGPAQAAAAEPNDRPHVLVVDDNHDAAEILAEALRLLGYEVVVAADSGEALDIAGKQHLDIGILDIGLPGMNGYELAKRLRQLKGSIYLVAVSGYGQERDRAASMDAGFAVHLTKPVELKALMQALASHQAPGPGLTLP
jgi:PAS domain S-box-containing protein